MKYLLLLLVVGVALWMLLRRQAPGGRGQAESGRAARKEQMVACAHCGVHLPLSEGVTDGTRVYCSEAHRLAGPK
jgi:uncharacterized protein